MTDEKAVPAARGLKLAAVLWFVAAALALAAAVVRFVRHGEIQWILLAPALFMTAMGWAAWKRARGARP